MLKVALRGLMFAALVTGATQLAACTPGTEVDSEAGVAQRGATVEVSVSLRGRDIELLTVRPSDEPALTLPSRGTSLRWELLDSSGNPISSGEVEDPRQVRSEFHEDFEQDVHGEVGMLTLVLPRQPGRLRFSEQSSTGWSELAEVRIPYLDPDESVSSSALVDASKDLIGQPVTIHAAIAAQGAVNLLVVGDGYTQGELSKFHSDANNLSAQLLAVDGYSRHAAQIAIHRQDVRSTQTGIADPNAGKDPVSAFEMSFGNGVSRPRRCVLFEAQIGAAALQAIRNRAEAVNADAIVILANTNEYGGCASPWSGVVTVTRHADSARILAHELGHTLFHLADEYEGTQCGVYEGGPNVATSLNKLPWKSMLTTSTLPTPSSASSQTVGAFKGANHCTSGYRPSKSCMMRELGSSFCPVCSAEMDNFFAQRSAGQTGAVKVRNETGGGIFVRCPDQQGASCSGWTYLAAGAKKTLQTSSAGYGLMLDTSTVSDPGVELEWQRVVPSENDVTIYANAADPLNP